MEHFVVALIVDNGCRLNEVNCFYLESTGSVHPWIIGKNHTSHCSTRTLPSSSIYDLSADTLHNETPHGDILYLWQISIKWAEFLCI